MGLLTSFVQLNRRISRKFDEVFLPESFSIDGNRDFVDTFALTFIQSGLHIYDVGGGKRPFISVAEKKRLNAYVVGLDIDGDELKKAPQGAYDKMIVADICAIQGSEDADLVICQALLEHVKDNDLSFKALAGLLKPDGKLIIFVPSRNAVFARLNVLLPEVWKRFMLFKIFPDKRLTQGFPSYYHRCTPKEFMELGKLNDLELIDSRYYYKSSYLSFFFPMYFIWRLWILIYSFLCGKQAAETFSMAFKKSPR